MKQEAQLMLTTGSTRLAVSRSQQTWYHSTLHIVSYCAIVTLSLRRALFTIFVFKKFHDLEMEVKGHSRSFVYGFLLVFFSNFVPKMHHF